MSAKFSHNKKKNPTFELLQSNLESQLTRSHIPHPLRKDKAERLDMEEVEYTIYLPLTKKDLQMDLIAMQGPLSQ